MKASFLEALRLFLGDKITAGLLLVVLGALGYWYFTSHFVSVEAFADEKAKLSDTIKMGDGTQQLQILYLRRDLIKNRVEEAEDEVEKKPNSTKWQSRLGDRKAELTVINVEIKNLNKRLSKEPEKEDK